MKFEASGKSYSGSGRLIDLENYDVVNINGCTFSGGGIYILAKQGMSIRITNCNATNITRGKESYGNFIQIAGATGRPPAPITLLISGNTVSNQPNQSSVEDNINLFNITGGPDNPLIVENNKITGAYPNPMNPQNAKSFSGSGIMFDKMVCYAVARGNTVTDTTNCGIGIAGGSHNRVGHNIVRTDKGYNVGIFSSGFSYPNDPFVDNKVAGNDVVWKNVDGKRNDYWLP